MSWSKRFIEWTDDNATCISVVFSWDMKAAMDRCKYLMSNGATVRVGGPAVDLNPHLVPVGAIVGGAVNALVHHNPDATFTTRGCIRKCKFCVVPKIEGRLRELSDDEWEPKPIICDNNLLAASDFHFHHVMDRLLESGITNIDFNQGWDARLLRMHHALHLRELHEAKQLGKVRLAWDHSWDEFGFLRAFSKLREAKIPLSKIGVYVLIGFSDTPEDALYRLEKVWSLRVYPNPMRYQPLDVKKRNGYVSPAWTDEELKRYTRYWSKLRWLKSVPFGEYDQHFRRGR